VAAAMIDLKHLDPSVREVVFSGPSDRKRVISDLPYIRSPIAEPALDAIRHWGNLRWRRKFGQLAKVGSTSMKDGLYDWEAEAVHG